MKHAALVFYLAVVSAATTAFAQDTSSPFYVVIGGFRDEANARRLCAYAEEQNLPAVYAFNEERKIYYVYVRETQNRQVAEDIRSRLRSTTVFRDAWIFNGPLSGTPAIASTPPPTVKELEPVVEKSETPAALPDSTSSAPVAAESPAPARSPAPVGKPFLFQLVDDETGEPVEGSVRVMESERAAQYRGYNANDKVYLPAPSNRSGKWIVVGVALGFKPEKRAVAYDRAEETKNATVGPDKEVIIPFHLKRVRKGDYIELDNVRFFSNAALLTPESAAQLDELVAMMKENTGYQIRLHGHTNGDDDRDFVSIGNSTNFFGSDVANAKKHGSAKELSLLRAELVKAYLVQQGVDAGRITTKGEGGRAMIYDPAGTYAALNDRVEVEIRKR